LLLSDEARELYSRFELSPERIAVIVGSLFGDASLLVSDKDRTPNFYENHSMKQIEYLKWKASMLGVPNGVRIRRMTHGYNKGRLVAYFQVRNRAFGDFERMFYVYEGRRRRKIVTGRALELLVGSAVALAVFHMDDGEYNAYSNQVILNTCDFTTQENEMIANRLSSMLGGLVRVKIKRKRYPTLALSGRATDEFIRIVKPCIHPMLQYKVDQDISHRLDERIVRKFKEDYGKKPARLVAAEAGVTFNEAQVIGHRLGLSRHHAYVRYRDRPFSQEEKEYFIRNYRKVPTSELATKLSTSVKCLYQLAIRLGLTRRPPRPE
jgi:hypothetical protein